MTVTPGAPPRLVLFDLDGTLIDSAPDLAGATNDMRIARGLQPLTYPRLRPMVGSGARGMLGVAFDIAPVADGYAALRDEFLDRYEQRMTRETAVFPQARRLLDTLTGRGVPWAIVTNKALRFAEPLVRVLGLADGAAAAVVGGDSTPHAKPHPAPLFEAARRAGVLPVQSAYVGDDLRDVLAGRAAGMTTVAVRWGYLGDGEPIDAWGADHVADSAEQVLRALRLA